MIAADGPDKALPPRGQDEAVQLRQPALLVYKIAAEQQQIGGRGRDDPLQLIDEMLSLAFHKMHIAHK